MIKRILVSIPVFASVFLLSGCSPTTSIFPSSDPMASATFIRSDDDGNTWNPKIRIDDKKNISGTDVLSMAVSPTDPNNIYLGTAKNGLFVTRDAGETWAQAPFADKAYGLVFDPRNPQIMYGSGIFNNRAKIYKRVQEGQEWKEVYTEPSDGTTISSLAINRANPQILYAGTSDGVIIKTVDGGQTWINLKINQNVGQPIVSIAFDAGNDQHVYFVSFQTGVLETKDGGMTISDITQQLSKTSNISDVYTLVSDPNLSGVAYVGTTEGIFRRTGDGKWNAMNLIESSKAFPIRTIAINPRNSMEIMYSSSKAIYKSTDGGNKWATFQLGTSKEISALKFNQSDPSKIYAGLRSF